jgi:hypothetical protein
MLQIASISTNRPSLLPDATPGFDPVSPNRSAASISYREPTTARHRKAERLSLELKISD